MHTIKKIIFTALLIHGLGSTPTSIALFKKLAIATVLTHNLAANAHDLTPDFVPYAHAHGDPDTQKNARANFTWPYLASLIEQHNVSAFSKALDQGANPDMQDTDTARSLLWQSVYQIWDTFYMTGQQPGTEIIDLLLQRNATPNTMSHGRLEYTPLMVASFFENLTHVAKKLLDDSVIKPNVDAINFQNTTALYLAASNNRYQVIPLLVKANASLEIRSFLSFTPLLAATTNGNDQASFALILFGADVNARDKQQYTPLHNACWQHSPIVVSSLLQNGANIDAQDYYGGTPLMNAVWREHPDIVRTLVDNKANVHIVDNQNCTALDLARAVGNREIIKILLEAKAHANFDDDSSISNKENSPLSKAMARHYAKEVMHN